VYHAVAGAALLPASILAGALWDRVGPAATFGAGAACAVAAALLLLVWLPAHRERTDRHAHAR
jgi:predicted MFS family arabinose efflux permease